MKKEKNILIKILEVGRDSLTEGKEIEIEKLKQKLESFGYKEPLISNALELFYPENFKGYYGKGTWLSSDGHIRLLQHESLIASEKNLKKATCMLVIASIALLVSIATSFISIFDKQVINSIKSIEQKQDSILMELKKYNHAVYPDTIQIK